jgi:hypothetical protein
LELVYLLAGTDARRRRLAARAREVLAGADFDLLARELAARRLLPLIGTRALEAAGDLAPEAFRAAVAQARAAARANALAVERATAHVVGSLAGEGIAALPLKGPLLAAEAHGDVGLRETADADVLVEPGALDRAVRVLVAGGFHEPEEVRGGDGLPELHFSLKHPSMPRVELHWRVHWYERSFSRDMLSRATPGPDGTLRAAPADLAASLLLFYARDGFHGVRLAADLAAWWDRHRDELPSAFLEDHPRRYPELGAVLTAAALAAERLTGTPATAWLGGELRPGRRVAVATRLADWTQHGDRDQLRANITLVDGLLGPRGTGRAFVRRELLPPGVGPVRRAVHAAKVCARFCLALWRVRGARSWASQPR